MLERGRLKGILMVVLTWVVYGLLFFSETETYKKIVHPDKYWKNKIETLKISIANSEIELANSYLEQQKLAKVSELKIKQAVNRAAIDGRANSEQERVNAVKDEEIEYSIIKSDIAFWIKQIETDNKSLIKAKAELAKHLGSQGGAN